MQHSMTQVYTNKLGEAVLTTDPLNDEAKLSLIHNRVIFFRVLFRMNSVVKLLESTKIEVFRKLVHTTPPFFGENIIFLVFKYANNVPDCTLHTLQFFSWINPNVPDD